ncbi:MAG TPA: hypothetical protein VFB23_03370 [Candidatus Acidoferrales bacterium]|nr:hypothetical protein [Candidatus Acidoferrales bacterium]
MKKIGVLVLMVLLSAFVVAVAQQPPVPSQPSPPGQTAGTMGCGMMGSMNSGPMGGGPMRGSPMAGGPMGMPAMAARHQQMVDLMDKLMQSMSAIEAEKDPAALKSKLAAHRALLEKMHSEMMQRGAMRPQRGMMPGGAMQQGAGMPNMPRMGGSANQAPPSK